MDDVRTLLKDLLFFFANRDMSNAIIHCEPVRFSPITFRIAASLNWQPGIREYLGKDGSELLDTVLSRRGQDN